MCEAETDGAVVLTDGELLAVAAPVGLASQVLGLTCVRRSVSGQALAVPFCSLHQGVEADGWVAVRRSARGLNELTTVSYAEAQDMVDETAGASQTPSPDDGADVDLRLYAVVTDPSGSSAYMARAGHVRVGEVLHGAGTEVFRARGGAQRCDARDLGRILGHGLVR